MKKKLLLTMLALVAIASESTGQVVINETNFPDDNFRNFLLSESFGADGVLTTNEIANEFYMEVYGKEIASLKGIEFFTELKEIDCSHNKLTSLDVSKNTKLTELYCEDNQIRGAQMDALIASLPNKKGNQLEFGVRDETKDIANDNDITMAQVAAAKAKGWIPMAYDGEDYTNYGGSDVSTIGIPIDSKNFPDFYFRRYLLDQDFGTDGVLTQQEIAEVTELWIIYEWISDLTGIEHFTALQELSVYNNSIKTLDLSKNTALESLDCSDNIISTLILPDNGKLAYLDCGENKLTSLTIPAGLQTLSCATNPDLTSLDLSAGASLKSLGCSYTALSSLDLSALTALEYLNCSNTKLTQLTLTANTALTDLYCNNLGLTSLDVSKNVALKLLQCSGNKLTTLDLSANTALRTLSCERNQLTSLDISKTVIANFYCGKNNIKGEQMDALIANLTTKTAGNLYVMYLNDADEGNEITKEQIAEAEDKEWLVYAYTETNGWMEYQGETGLLIDYVNFPDQEFRYILKHLGFGIDGMVTDQENEGLTSLDIKRNDFIYTLKGIEHFTYLQELTCYSLGNLTELDLSANTKLQTLDCSKCAITSLILPNTTSLVKIECYKNQIKGENMTALVENLPTVESGDFYVLTLTDPDESNEITTTHVATAKAKGWKVWAYTSTGWQEYEGSEPTAIMTITATEGIQSGYYYTLDGQRVAGKPVRKGIYILNGKKVVVK